MAALPVYAENFGANISLSSQVSDNPNKTADDQNNVNERQDEYALGVFGNYENSVITLEANYVASENRFEKDSQPDRSILEGDSQLRFGKESQLFDLLLVHSRRSLLNTPDDIDVLANRDERDIVAVIPTFHAPITAVDDVLVRASYSRTSYRYNELRDSEALGGSLIWQHKLSAVDVLELSAQQTEIEFEFVPTSNYTYQNVMLSYSAMLSQFKYTVAAGYNVSKPEVGEEYSSPNFAAEVDYVSGANRFTLYAYQGITDSSTGDANRQSVGGAIDPGDVSGTEVDQIERRSLDLRWALQAICERCELSVNLFARDDNYININEDNKEHGGGIGASYRLSNAAKLSVNFQRRDQRFDENVTGEEFTYDEIRGEYQYDFVSDLSATLYIEKLERESQNNLTDYEELIGGLTLTYNF